MTFTRLPLKRVADIRVSNVDKKSVEGQPKVRLCNYTDVYYRDSISPDQEFMEATATKDQIETFGLQPGDVLVTKDSETADDIGVPAYVASSAPDLLCGYHLAVVRPRPEAIDGRYLHWAMNSRWTRGQLEAQATGVTRFGLRAEALRNTEIACPSLEEQRQLAQILDVECERLDRLVKARVRSLDLFSERLSAEISTAIAHAADGFEPFKWCLAGKLAYGANESATESDTENPRYIRITDITPEGNLRDETFRSLSPEFARPHLLRTGDLLLARSGATVGKAFLYDEHRHDSPACYAGYLIRARLDQRKVVPRFAYYWTQSAEYWSEISVSQIQATIQNVSAERFGAMPFPRVDLKRQREIVEQLDSSTEQTARLRDTIHSQIELLRERREALITAAVTGMLDSV